MGLETRMPQEEKQPGQYVFTPPPDPPPPAPTVTPVTDTPAETPPPDWRELRRQERAAGRANRSDDNGYGWVGGIVLIVLGAIFLLQNTGMMTGFDNWWALFILIPAIGSFAAAWRAYQQAGNRWTTTATGSLFGGLLFCSIAGMFLFGLNIGMWWPVFLILGGVAALFGVRQW